MKERVSRGIALEKPAKRDFPVMQRAYEFITNPKRIGAALTRTGTYLLLSGFSFVFLFPFLYMLVNSLKTNADLNNILVNWVPRDLKFENYIIAYRALDYFTYAKNSVFITIVTVIGHLLSCSLIGYGFARYNFPCKKVLFLLVILALIVPVQTLIVPMYMVYANFGWLNSYLPIIVPTFLGYGLKGTLFIFIFRQYYLGLPKDLENAAKIDGAGFLMTYWRIVLPIAQSALLVTVVLSMVWHWNDFYEPGIYAQKATMTMLPARLNNIVRLVNLPPEEMFEDMQLIDQENSINNAVLMAGTFMVITPILIVFGFLQKKFMQGIERTGLTGE